MSIVCSDRLDAVRRFANDEEIGFLVDDVRHSGAQERVIVNDEHAESSGRRGNGVGHGYCPAAGGSHASTT